MICKFPNARNKLNEKTGLRKNDFVLCVPPDHKRSQAQQRIDLKANLLADSRLTGCHFLPLICNQVVDSAALRMRTQATRMYIAIYPGSD